MATAYLYLSYARMGLMMGKIRHHWPHWTQNAGYWCAVQHLSPHHQDRCSAGGDVSRVGLGTGQTTTVLRVIAAIMAACAQHTNNKL